MGGWLCSSAVNGGGRMTAEAVSDNIIKVNPSRRVEFLIDRGSPPGNINPEFWKYAAMHRLRYGLEEE